MSERRGLWIVLLCALWGCGGDPEERIIYQDYPVEFAEQDELEDIQGEPELIIGVFDEQLFKKLEEGDTLSVVRGFQGGIWVHISIRALGVLADGTIHAELGELGSISYPLKLVRSAEGFLEAYDIPIPVRLVDGVELDSLDGGSYTLRVTFEAGERTLSEELTIILMAGS